MKMLSAKRRWLQALLSALLVVLACSSDAPGKDDKVSEDRMLLTGGTGTGGATKKSNRQDQVYSPNLHGCLGDVAKALPYCDTSLSQNERLDDLLSRLSLEEQIAQLTPQRHLFGVDACATVTLGSEPIGLPPWLWLEETNTQVNSACLQEGHCATTFVGPLGLGASFNRTSWRLKGSVFGTEIRALNNLHASRFRLPNKHKDPPIYAPIGLTGFGPNINIVRDPRFGRNSELPGEDPLLSGTYAYEMVSGMQERDSRGYPKMAAFLKHFTAYSTEHNRGHDTYNISLYDFFDTYLPQYERAFKADPYGVMCSYNSENGVPSCANDWLLNKVLRSWNCDALVTTDCGAVSNLKGSPVNAPDDVHAAAYALMNGTDLEMGTTLFSNLEQAVSMGLATKERIAEAVRRTFKVHFDLGRFDPPSNTDWSTLGLESLNSTLHQQINYEAALQSLVLLQNNNNALPLDQGIKVAVVGPQAQAKEGLLSDYAGDQICFAGSHDCITSIVEGVAAANVEGITQAANGVELYNTTNTKGIPEAVELAKNADAVVLVLGIDRRAEQEGVDRTDTALRGLQESFALQILSLNKPTILVLTNGGALAVDNLIQPLHPNQPYAIVEAFNPSLVGGKALGASFFGLENKWGKLPITMYPHKYVREQPMSNYEMSKSPGRTYKYYEGTPLFRFGHGLSLTTFSFSCELLKPRQMLCSVRNTGARTGDEVLQVYHRATDIGKVAHPLPRRALVEFCRLSDIAEGGTATASFHLSDDMFEVVNQMGKRVVYPGKHDIIVSRGSLKDEQVFQITIPESLGLVLVST